MTIDWRATTSNHIWGVLQLATLGEENTVRFDHDIHQRAFEQVEQYLSELFDDPYLDPETHHFYVQYGSTVLELFVEAYGPDEAIVTIDAYCVQGVEPEAELLSGLMELNHHLPVGAFSVIGRDVFFSHTLFGTSLDREGLLRALEAVATVSDDYDDRISVKYGGQTALDRIRDTGGRAKRKKSTELG